MAAKETRVVLQHYLGSIAYHAQKAIREAPAEYWTYAAGNRARTPMDVLRHMTSVLGYARTFFRGGSYRPEPLPTIGEEIDRFHGMLQELSLLLESGAELHGMNELQLLQGPLSDVMTHIGQLSLLRRLHGTPIPPEDFIYADITTSNLGRDQPSPRRPDREWPEEKLH